MTISDNLSHFPILAAEIHKLESRLWRVTRRSGRRIIMFTSPARGEGKSTTVAYLAAAMGLHPERRILAIDMDLREPTLGRLFGVASERGFGAVLREELTLSEGCLRSGYGNLDLLVPGDQDESSLIMRTPQVDRLFQAAREKYDLVLVDTPAVLPVADATVIMPFVDGIVLVAMAGLTTKPQLARTREICRGMEAEILGLVIGNIQEAIPGHDGEYGYGYGYGYETRHENGKRNARPSPGGIDRAEPDEK